MTIKICCNDKKNTKEEIWATFYLEASSFQDILTFLYVNILHP